MKNTSTKKSTILAILLSSFISLSITQEPAEVYTIQQAQQCFHSQALAACEDKINQCLTIKQCEKELHFYHDCNFDKEYTNQVFNGNCFKDWKNTASASKQVIQCLDSQCNLAGYNSEVSLRVFYSCAAEALIDYKVECDEQCQKVLQKQISQKIPYQPINEIYGKLQKSDMNGNQNVQRLVQIIKKQCIAEDGSIRKRHDQDLLKKKTNRQRMVDRMNQKNKDEAYLKQYESNNGSKLTPQEL